LEQPNSYIPGVCNIGKEEIARRAAKLRVALALLFVTICSIVFLGFNYLLFAIAISITVYTAILLFQIQLKFCILYGWMHLFNFNTPSQKKGKVVDTEWRKKDQIQAIKIVIYSLLTASVVAFLLLLLR
jgi:hypothetical protein